MGMTVITDEDDSFTATKDGFGASDLPKKNYIDISILFPGINSDSLSLDTYDYAMQVRIGNNKKLGCNRLIPWLHTRTFAPSMKTKTLKKDKVNIITLGCSKNMVDSEVLSGQLMANDIDVVHENKRSDHNIVVVNTCGFIEKAKEESINTILDQVELKRRGKLDKVYVTGA